MILIVDEKPENSYSLRILVEKMMLLIYLPEKTKLPVAECEEKEKLINGKIYFAPSDYDLL